MSVSRNAEGGEERSSMKLLIGGPPHSGKTCLREALRKLIFAYSGRKIYPGHLPANPDGDGRWYVVTALEDAGRANDLRKRSPTEFTQAFAARVAEAIQKFETPLLLIDMGGKPDKHKKQIEEIAKRGTHAILLYKEPEDLKVWEPLFQGKEIAKFVSIHDPGTDSVQEHGGVLQGTVHHLDREQDGSALFAVQELARHI